MTDDWTKEIRERLAAYKNSESCFWYEGSTPEECAFLESAPNAIARLLEEREVLRKALKYYSHEGDFSYAPDVAQRALAYVPEGVEEK